MTDASAPATRRSLLLFGAVMVVLTVLMFIAVVWAFRWISAQGGTREEFVKTAGLWFGAITAVLTGAIGVFSAHLQSRWARELEQTRLGLNTTLEATKASFNIDVEEVKGRLNRTLEFAKGRYAAERKAYDELLAVAYAYYYTLASLERHRWSSKQVSKADDAMVASCRYLAAVDSSDRDVWVSFWQAARAVEEEAGKLGGTVKEDATSVIGTKRHELWARQASRVGGTLGAFVDAATRKHQQLDDSITKVGSRRPSG
jgi:hypothetical protein